MSAVPERQNGFRATGLVGTSATVGGGRVGSGTALGARSCVLRSSCGGARSIIRLRERDDGLGIASFADGRGPPLVIRELLDRVEASIGGALLRRHHVRLG